MARLPRYRRTCHAVCGAKTQQVAIASAGQALWRCLGCGCETPRAVRSLTPAEQAARDGENIFHPVLDKI